MSDCAQPRQGAAYNETYHTHTPSIHTTHFYFHSVTIMSAMPGPIPGSHTASHEPTRVCTLTIHDVTHLPLCASTGGGLGAIPSLHFLPLPSTTSSMTPRVVQTQSFSTSATSTSPPREASYIRRRQTALQLLLLLTQSSTSSPPSIPSDERRRGQSVRRHSEFATYLIGPSSRAALLPQQALSMRHLLLSTLFSSTTRRASSHYSNDGEHPFTPCSRLNSPLQKALISRHFQDFDGLHFAKER